MAYLAAYLARSAAPIRAAAQRRTAAALVSGHWRPCRPPLFGSRAWPLSIRRRSDARPFPACKIRSKSSLPAPAPPLAAANSRLGQHHCPNVACQILATETSVRLSLNSPSESFHIIRASWRLGSAGASPIADSYGKSAAISSGVPRPVSPFRRRPRARIRLAGKSTFGAVLMAGSGARFCGGRMSGIA